MSTGKQEFLDTYDEEHARTMRVLSAYPKDKLDLRPHPKCKTARELAWVFVLERYLGTKVWHDEYAKGPSAVTGKPPSPPENWDEQIAALEKAHNDFRDLVAPASDEVLHENVHFFKVRRRWARSRARTGSGFCSTTRSITAASCRSICAWRMERCRRSTGRARMSLGFEGKREHARFTNAAERQKEGSRGCASEASHPWKNALPILCRVAAPELCCR